MDRKLCETCVYYVKNLPREAYPEEEWKLIEKLECSIDAEPGDKVCELFRKSSCSIVNLGGEKE
ncbi:hypothetical protein [Hydrogenivirga sp.]